MAVIEKKIWPDYFDLIQSGKKRFEFRLADFDLAQGDTLILREWDPKTKEYTGRQIEKRVGYLHKFNLNSEFYKKEDLEKYGFYIIQLD